jgi:hypothetical protein
LDGTSNVPYVGLIDLDHCLRRHVSRSKYKSRKDSRDRPPGYRIPPAGTIQVVIKNAHRSIVKVFLVRYDISEMPIESRSLIRHKQHYPADGIRPKSLRYALQLPVVCCGKGRHYLSGALRVVFSGVKDSEHLDQITEGPKEFTHWSCQSSHASINSTCSKYVCTRVDEDKLFHSVGGSLSGDFARDSALWQDESSGLRSDQSYFIESEHFR